MSVQNEALQSIPSRTSELASTSSDIIFEDSLTCPLCLEMFDTSLEAFTQAKARQSERTSARKPLLASTSRLPVSCTSCFYTFCNACLHRLMYRFGGVKCPICPHTVMNAAAPPVNIPLVRLLRSIKPMVETPPAAHAGIPANAVTPVKHKTKTPTKAKHTKTKTASKAKQERAPSSVVGEYGLLKDDVYQVEAIVGRRSYNRQRWYKVRWVGFSEMHDTWELWKNLKHLEATFHQQMQQFDEQFKKERYGKCQLVNVSSWDQTDWQVFGSHGKIK